MLRLLRCFKLKEWAQVILCVLFIVLQVYFDLKLPDFMTDITMLVQTEGSEMADIWLAGGKMLACAFGSMIMAIATGFFAARLAAILAKRTRSAIYRKVSGFSMEEINKFSTASLITRSTNDVTQVQMMIAMGLQVMIKAPITGVWAVCKILGKAWQWSIATGVAIICLLLLVAVMFVLVLPKFKKIQGMTDRLNKVTREHLTGLRVVRAYNAEDYQEKKFKKANDDLTNLHLFTGHSMSIMMPFMMLIMNGLSLSIYWIGTYVINDAALTDKMALFSDMVVYLSYAMQIVMAFMMIVVIFILLPRASVSAKRINEVLDTKTKIEDGMAVPENKGGTVEFKNVSFKYPDAADYVLEDISFTANSGETIAFIGATGSGKSTLINLIPRFYDCTEGEILVDGVNVKEFKLEELNKRIGYVSQKAVMFAGTIKSNILFGDNDNSEENMKKAMDIAQGTEFIEKKEDGFDSHMAQGGSNLSGGQKQRVAIARALARNAEIFIFDDSFSALDYKTDKILRGRLKEEVKGATNFIVAQRIGTIKDADKIIVLEKGKIAGMGTHAELLKNCQVYKEIALSQLSEEELGYEER